jgi:Na+/H+ antiporter NhaD/arsenite permease-like protein
MTHLSSALAQNHWIPAVIFLATYILIAVESGRGSHLDRTAAAFCGAVAMVLVGAVPLSEAYQTIDWNTLIFLLGIMILVAHFQISGFFDWIAVHVASIARTRWQLLVLVIFTAGVLAAFFVNDTICLIFTPIVLVVTERLEVPTIPYLIAVATSANIGSAMSVTGNPQNAVIGVSAHFSFLGFLGHLAPVSVVGMLINVMVLSVFFRKELLNHPLKQQVKAAPVKVERTLLVKCCFAAALVIVLWILGYSFPLVAISVGAFILIIGRVKSQNIYRRLDWELLLFFASLFVVIKGFEASGAIEHVIGFFQSGLQGSMISQLFAVSGVMLVLSNLVSNLPAVILFRSVVSSFPNTHYIWLAVASTSTLAGNATPFSSVANLIVLQQAGKKVKITFWEFARVGLIITLITSLAAIAILALEHRFLPAS